MSELNWTEEQNNMVAGLIAEEIEKARLSHKFIPQFEIGEDVRSVPADEYDSATNVVDDIKTIPLVELAASVNLTKLQAEDSDLSAALLLIRRAANRLARTHDAVVFTGQLGPDASPAAAPAMISASGGAKNDGISAAKTSVDVNPPKGTVAGEELVKTVSESLVKLEGAGYIGSYVLVLGQQLFTDAHTPSAGSLVLPRDKLEPLLEGGPIYRSSVLGKNDGLLLSLGGEPMDRAIAVPPKFEFLRIGAKEVRECRVFERFALRLKEKDSVIKLVRK